MPVFTLGIATTDGVSVCDHLARCRAVTLFQIENGAVVAMASRLREVDACGNHRSFTDLLAGCDAVICGGVGQGAVNSLRAAGIEPIVLAVPMSLEAAATGYVAGTLLTTQERVCLCG